MRNYQPICIVILTLLLTSCKIYKTFPTANKDILGLKAPQFRGSIFKYTYPFEYLIVSEVDSFNRFTPSVGEIREAENILRRDMKATNRGKPNQLKHYPDISKKSNKYFRQYVGFIDSKGEKLIHFNCHWDRYTLWERLKLYDDSRLSFHSDYTITLDGGSRYWQTLINLDQKKVIGWSVNGIALHRIYANNPDKKKNLVRLNMRKASIVSQCITQHAF